MTSQVLLPPGCHDGSLCTLAWGTSLILVTITPGGVVGRRGQGWGEVSLQQLTNQFAAGDGREVNRNQSTLTLGSHCGDQDIQCL